MFFILALSTLSAALTVFLLASFFLHFLLASYLFAADDILGLANCVT